MNKKQKHKQLECLEKEMLTFLCDFRKEITGIQEEYQKYQNRCMKGDRKSFTESLYH